MYSRSISTRFARVRQYLLQYTFLRLSVKVGWADPPCFSHPFEIRSRAFHAPNFSANALFSVSQRQRTLSCWELGTTFRGYASGINWEGSDDNGIISDVTTAAGVEITTIDPHIANEVAIAAADSSLPVAALQYFIDIIHSFTGLNWWASIAITTVLIRTATVPLLINTLKSSLKLAQLRPQMEEIRQEMFDSRDPSSMMEGQKKMKMLLKRNNVSPFSPMKGMLIQGPVFVSFFFAINNMIEKVPSFKTGGIFWFTDLTTVDSLCIFPVLTGLTFLITVELNVQEGMEGNPIASTMKKVSRVFGVLAVPLTMNFPKALFCYWITSNMFSLLYGLVIKQTAVKKFLGVPDLPPMSGPGKTLPFFGGPDSIIGRAKRMIEHSKCRDPPSFSADDHEKLPDLKVSSSPCAKVSSSSSANINHRLQTLERKVKGRRKHKKH